MDDIRYANVGLAIGLAIVIAGVWIFKDSSEAGMQASALAGFLVGLAVTLTLAGRAQRRRDKRQ
jgi:hypothetical protein